MIRIILTLLLFLAFFSCRNPSQQNSLYKKIAFIQGHNEWNEDALIPLLDALYEKNFEIDMGTLSGNTAELNRYRTIVIASPRLPFNDQEKYIIDQYIMQGGRVLWLINGVTLSQSLLYETGETPSMALDLNINDLLFRYGFRINSDLLASEHCENIDVLIGEDENHLEKELLPWSFSPHLKPIGAHYSSRNVKLVNALYCSSVDFVGNSSRQIRIPLLTTFGKGQRVIVPEMIALPTSNHLQLKESKHYIVAATIEGEFESLYKNRIPPIEHNKKNTPLTTSHKTKQMVCGTGYITIEKTGCDNTLFLTQAIEYLCE